MVDQLQKYAHVMPTTYLPPLWKLTCSQPVDNLVCAQAKKTSFRAIYIFIHTRSTIFEEKPQSLWTGYFKIC